MEFHHRSSDLSVFDSTKIKSVSTFSRDNLRTTWDGDLVKQFSLNNLLNLILKVLFLPC